MNQSMKIVQSKLKDLGFDPGPLDGVGGKKTAAAYQAFLASQGLHFTVSATATTLTATGPLDVSAPVVLGAGMPRLPWIEEGRKVFGLHEVRDKAKLQTWLRSDGMTLGDPTALPWCGDAVETLIKNSLPDEPITGLLGKNPYWARNWMMFGTDVEPCYGAIGVFERPKGGHVGILIGKDRDHFLVLGGNQGNAFNISALDSYRLLGARWPSTHGGSGTPLPVMDADHIPKSVNEF